MELEKIATSALEMSIGKTDRLSSFINNGDKEPCWDGNIYIHEGKGRSKKGIKKVPVQVKGKAVTPDQIKETVEYRISYDDLAAYLRNGGTMFFVVYIDNDTGNPLQIYYSELLPLKIKGIINKNEEQKSFQVYFHKFPDNNYEKTALFLKFYNDAQRQASFADVEIPTIEELTNKNILESISFQCVGLDEPITHIAVPKLMNGKSLSLYANTKDGTIPIPVQFFESIHCVTLKTKTELPVYVNGTKYYDGYDVITTEANIKLQIGSCVAIIFPNNTDTDEQSPITIRAKITGTLKQQIVGIDFVRAMIRYGSFHIDNIKIPLNVSEIEADGINLNNLDNQIEACKKVQSILDLMNVKKDLDLHKCSDEDINKLNFLIGTVSKGLPVKEGPEKPSLIQKVNIANITLALTYIDREQSGYYVRDYFSSDIKAKAYYSFDGQAPMEITRFVVMSPDDFLCFDNLNLENVVNDCKSIPISEKHYEHVNTIMLNMLEAYDRKQSGELLKAAMALCEMLQEHSEFAMTEYAVEFAVLNKLQIVLRERALTFQEKSELHAIATGVTDTYGKIGAYLLLNEQPEAKLLLDTLSDDELERFKAFPIYKFYTNVADGSNNS